MTGEIVAMSKVIDFKSSPLVLEWLETELEQSLSEPFISNAWQAQARAALINIKKEESHE